MHTVLFHPVSSKTKRWVTGYITRNTEEKINNFRQQQFIHLVVKTRHFLSYVCIRSVFTKTRDTY